MQFMQRMAAKCGNLLESPIPTVAFLGDSVTQGCFDVCLKDNHFIDTEFCTPDSYSEKFRDIMAHLFPQAPLHIVNAGISGDNAPNSAKRLERDVLRYHPDLCIVCLGLNDCNWGMDNIPQYTAALQEIFTRLQENGCEVIFMTPNSVARYLSFRLTDSYLREQVQGLVALQQNGTLDAYVQAARDTAVACHVPICDCYRIWDSLYRQGVDTTELLANHINHPTPKMHELFAYALLQTILEN